MASATAVGVMPLPRTLPAQPTREQIIAAVEDNTSRVRSYSASQAVLSVPGVPRLSAQVACEPPRRFRLRAQTSLTGNELDIGSNDDLFWLWILLIAVGASVALSLMTKAYQLAETSYLAIYEYAYLISVGLFGWIFWGIIPGIMSIIGIILIVFAGVLIVIAQQRPKEKI